jgi:hypothetical protein
MNAKRVRGEDGLGKDERGVLDPSTPDLSPFYYGFLW